jgi:hypothetical protein
MSARLEIDLEKLLRGGNSILPAGDLTTGKVRHHASSE